MLLRVENSKVNKRVLESLIKAGAFDRFGKRSALLATLPEIKDRLSKLAKNKDTGQSGLFDVGAQEGNANIKIEDNLPNIAELPMSEMLSYEKQLLGFYVSDHPARNIMRHVASRITHKIKQLDKDFHNGQTVTVVGILTSIRLVNTKKSNSKMAFGTLEDDTGKVDLVIFPKLYADSVDTWVVDKPVLITGKVDNRDTKLGIIVDKGKVVDTQKQLGNTFEIDIPRGTPKEILSEINDTLKSHPGNDTVIIVIPNGGAPKRIQLSYTVNYDGALTQKISHLLDSPIT